MFQNVLSHGINIYKLCPLLNFGSADLWPSFAKGVTGPCHGIKILIIVKIVYYGRREISCFYQSGHTKFTSNDNSQF